MNFDISWPFFQTTDTTFQSVFFENDLKVIIPELFLVLCTLGLIVYGVVMATSKHYNYPILVSQLSWLAQLALGWTIVLLITNPWSHCAVLSNSFIVDYGTTFFKVLILAGTMVTLWLSQDFLCRQSMNSFEFPLFFLLSATGMICFLQEIY